MINPFVSDKTNRIRRSTKLVILYSEIILLFLASGLFFNGQTVSNKLLYIYMYIG